MRSPPTIVLSAGEASGDRLGAGLARALSERIPGVRILGMGGDEMAAAGVELVQHASEVAVVGLLEVVRHLPAIRRAMARMEDLVRRASPDLLVPIDFPDFNLRLSARAKRAGVPVVYFVSPQVWAWRPGRVRTIRDLVRRMLVLFPFEAPFYERAGIPVTFVGHPAAAQPSRDAREARIAAGLDPDRRTVALLPGSRRVEVRRLLPLMLAVAGRLAEGREQLQFVVPRAPTLSKEFVEAIVRSCSFEATIRVVEGFYREILAGSTVGLVASGTASLDAALAGTPSVVVYRMHPLSYLVARRLVRVDHIALPNLIAGERILPELVQGAFTPKAAASIVGAWLDRPDERDAVSARLLGIRERLRGEGAFERAAAAIEEELAIRAF